jgi:hypothetical protein
MFGQNQDDQQAVVPPPDNVTNGPTNSMAVAPEPPMPSDSNIVRPYTASATELEPEVQPISPAPQTDDLAIPNDIKDEDVAPTSVAEPTANEPSAQPVVPQATDEEEETEPEVNVSEDSDAYKSDTQDSDSPATDTDLDELKHKALEALSPLVDELDQTPEEKFHTTMMMIQAADNKDLLPKAYEAAQAIEDDKVKAQALLDVVNEINYFSQN